MSNNSKTVSMKLCIRKDGKIKCKDNGYKARYDLSYPSYEK